MKRDVSESYGDYKPPFPLKPIVEDLLRCVNAKHLAGLKGVRLTDSQGLPRAESRRRIGTSNNSSDLSEKRGFYQPATRDAEAYIQLHVDKLFSANAAREDNLLVRPLITRMRLDLVLYHEIGHHIHVQQDAERGASEKAASRYMSQLLRRMLFRRWYLLPLAFIGMIPSAIRSRNADE